MSIMPPGSDSNNDSPHECEDSIDLTPGVVWTDAQLDILRDLTARLFKAESRTERVEGVARRLDACHGMTLDRPGEARAYREGAEWIRQALAGDL